MQDSRSIGIRIKNMLKVNGMNQKQLAEKIFKTQVSVSRYIDGGRMPSGTTVALMADALNTTTDYLLGLEDESRNGKCLKCDNESKDWKYDTIPIDAGDFGKYEMCMFISEGRKTIGIDFEEVNNEPILSKHFPIKYCPFCGRKL